MILFNDLVVYFSRSTEETKTKITHSYEGSLPLARGARIKKLPMAKSLPWGFAVVCNNRSYTFGCRSEEERDQWTAAIEVQAIALQSGLAWNGGWVDVQGTEDRAVAKSNKTYTVYKLELQVYTAAPQ